MLAFVLVVLVMFLIPGPAVILTVSQSLNGGKKAGIFTGMGIAVGDLIHTLAATLGLSAVLMTSAFAFELVKYAGAAYLVWLGIKSFLEKPKGEERQTQKEANPFLSFRQAIWIELLNPKTALFFLAFLPQFVQPEGRPAIFQLLILGLTFVLMSIIYTTLLAFLASFIKKLISSTDGSSRWQGKLLGTIYIGLGLHLVFQTQK
ncbi:MAG TPA: LysE family translocator [Chondromyces sp.]|nr:LysE family translocator [Chondromyces sp.]